MNALRLETYNKTEAGRVLAVTDARKASEKTGKRYQVSLRKVGHARHWCVYTLGKIRDKR